VSKVVVVVSPQERATDILLATCQVFLPAAAAYQPELKNSVGQYYNESAQSPWLNERQHPRPFAVHHALGLGAVYPFFMDAGLTGQRATEVLDYVTQGGFFGPDTKQVGDAKSSQGDAESSLGDAESSLGDAKSSLGDAKSSLGDAESSLGDATSSLGDATSSLGDAKSSLGDTTSSLGDARSSLGDARSSLGDVNSSLGDARSSLGDAKSSLGDAKSSLGDAKSSLGDAESSLGDVKSSLGVGLGGGGVRGVQPGAARARAAARRRPSRGRRPLQKNSHGAHRPRVRAHRRRELVRGGVEAQLENPLLICKRFRSSLTERIVLVSAHTRRVLGQFENPTENPRWI
jgi:hypothetical protein